MNRLHGFIVKTDSVATGWRPSIFNVFFMVKCLLRFEETAEVSSLCALGVSGLYGNLNILSQSVFVSCSGYFSQGYCTRSLLVTSDLRTRAAAVRSLCYMHILQLT